MARKEWFKNGNNTGTAEDFKLPITGGPYFTDEFSEDYSSGVLVVAAYDASGDIVTATGNVAPKVKVINGQWQTSSNGSDDIDLATAGPEATYTLPAYVGPFNQGRLTLNTVAGADHLRAFIWRDS